MLLHDSDGKSPNPSGNRLIRPIDDVNIYYFGSLLRKVNWLALYNLGSLNDKFDYFLNVFLGIVDMVFPVRHVSNDKSKRKKPRWYNKDLSSLKEQCLLMYYKFKDTGQENYSESYKLLRKRYKCEITQAKQAYFCNRVITTNSKPKAIWSVVKDNLNSNDKPIVQRKPPKLTSEGFNDYFISNVESIVQTIRGSNQNVAYYLNNLKQIHSTGTTVFSVGNFSVEEVYSTIFSLNNSTSLDVYCRNSYVLKLAAPHIVEILTYLSNQCIGNCTFPHCLKLTKVVPLFKKGVKSEFSNYRPVSIIPVVGKVLEKLLN